MSYMQNGISKNSNTLFPVSYFMCICIFLVLFIENNLLFYFSLRAMFFFLRVKCLWTNCEQLFWKEFYHLNARNNDCNIKMILLVYFNKMQLPLENKRVKTILSSSFLSVSDL